MVTSLIPAAANGAEFVLAIGGGPDAVNSQVSLERNVRVFQSWLKRTGWQNAKTTILFGAGRQDIPDVAYERTEAVGRLPGLLSDVFGPRRDPRLVFRRHDLPGDPRAATRNNILGELAKLAEVAQSDDRVLIYVTGHGAKGSPETNASIYTWGREKVSVREMSEALDRFDPEVRVLLVMAQCYAGSFANVIFTAGDPDRGLSNHCRAGLFATNAALPSDGCTTKLPGPSAQEYSLALWQFEGSCPSTLGQHHLQLLAALQTIDAPTTTSDYLLRRFAPRADEDVSLFEHERDFSRLQAVATVDERKVFGQLSHELGLGGENRIRKAVRRIDDVVGRRLDLEQKQSLCLQTLNRLRGELAKALRLRWPALDNGFDPSTQRLIQSKSDRILDVIRNHQAFGNYEKQLEQRASLGASLRENRLLYAKLIRLIGLAETVALRFNLHRSGDPKAKAKFEQLVSLETAL